MDNLRSQIAVERSKEASEEPAMPSYGVTVRYTFSSESSTSLSRLDHLWAPFL